MQTPTDEVLSDIRAYQEAKATAEQHGWDTHALRYHYTKYQFGSLANNHEAAGERRRFWRALQLAEQRKAAA